MPIGKGVVLIGMGERTTHQAVGQVARALFSNKAATRVIGCLMPKSRAAMHLDTVFSFCDRDLVTIFTRRRRPDPAATASIRPTTGRFRGPPGREAAARGRARRRWASRSCARWRPAATPIEAEREQWDDGNNVVALEPGVVVAYDRNTHTNTLAAQGRRRSDHDPRRRARPRPWRRPLHDLSDLARSGLLTHRYEITSTQGETIMSFNLRNRSLLTVQDYTPREFQLSARPRPRPEARQVCPHRAEAPRGQGDLPDLREDLDAHALRVRGRLLRPGRQRHLSRSGRLADRPQGILQGYRARARDACTTRSSIAARRRGAWRQLAKYAGVPVYNGLTDEYHPTQMLADVMTMREHSDKPISEIKYAYVGDTRSNMGHSLMIVGCLMGMDVRICGPKSAVAVGRIHEDRQGPGGEVRRAADDHGRPEAAVKDVDFIHTDVWVSMGEPKEVWKERIKLLTPYQVNPALMKAERQSAGQVHALPAGLPRHRDRRSASRSRRTTA